jgi:hypothetical protein
MRLTVVVIDRPLFVSSVVANQNVNGADIALH